MRYGDNKGIITNNNNISANMENEISWTGREKNEEGGGESTNKKSVITENKIRSNFH